MDSRLKMSGMTEKGENGQRPPSSSPQVLAGIHLQEKQTSIPVSVPARLRVEATARKRMEALLCEKVGITVGRMLPKGGEKEKVLKLKKM